MASHVFMLTNRNLQDMNPLILGQEACAPGHSFGPAVRKYTLIHYVCSGTGEYITGGRAYCVHPGQAFLILPGEVTTYTADLNDPWEYQWVGFDGRLSARFLELPPVFEIPEDILPSMIREASLSDHAEYQIASILLRLYASLFSGHSSTNQHVRRVESFIQNSFMQPVTVEQIASQMNLDRRYLTRLFKEKTGKTIQEYLIHVRLKEAREYLRKGSSVQEAATLCGYEDMSNFSRMFKQRYGLSPAHWKEKNGT